MLQDRRTFGSAACDGSAADGEMVRRVREFDWARTPLGPRERWPVALRTAVDICLRSRHPVNVLLGPDLIQVYNDAYRPMLGARHPRALGQTLRECWWEAWHVVGPIAEEVIATGHACWFEDFPMVLRRNGYDEETYFTFSYSRLEAEAEVPGGVFVEVLETTDEVIGRRRNVLLHELATRTADVYTTDHACDVVAAVLGADQPDVPFAALYLADGSGDTARPRLHVGRIAGLPAAAEPGLPATSPLAAALAAVSRRREPVVCDGVRAGPDAAEHTAVVLPVQLPTQASVAGVMVLGVSRRRPFDIAYRQFLEMVCSHVAAALARARGHAEEQRRIAAEATLELRTRAEAELRRQALVFEMLSEAVVLTDAEGRITGWNPAATAMTGYSAEEMPGRQVPSTLVRAEDVRSAMILDAMRRDGAWTGEIPFVRKDGSSRLGEVTTVGEYDAGGRLVGTISIARDITERRRAEEALRRRNEQLTAIVRMQQDVAMASLDLKDVMWRIAECAQQLTGAEGALVCVLDSEAVVISAATGMYASRLDARIPRARSIADWTLRTGLVARIDDTHEDERVSEHLGDFYGRSFIAVPLLYDQERIGALAVGAGRPGAFGDHDEQALTITAGLLAAAMAHAMAFEAKRRLIAERTAALGALERSEERLRALSECSPAGIFAADEEGRNTYVNARLAEAIGAPVESFRGDGWQRYVHPEDREDFARSWKNAVERREAMSREMRFVSSAGRVLVTHVRSAPLVLANGQLVGYVVTCEDVTEQKAAAEARRRAEGQYRQLVESMDAVVWRAAGDPPRLTFVSQQAEDIFGREARALVGGELPVADLTRPEDVAAITADIATVRQRHAALQHEFRIRTADGRERWLRSLLRRVPDSAEPGEIIGVTFDVTELRCAQEELARSRQQLRDFASELQTIRERERTHIAREIHDELGQALTGLKMELAWLRTKLPKRSTKLVETAEHMVAQVDRTIETVRRIASALRPSVLDSLGLVAALEWLVREFERNTRMRCTLRVFDDRAEPGPERSTAVFRIVQEALTNVARHGNASSVEVTVARDGADLLVAVRDDGCGIPAEAAHGSRSVGILGMRERAIASGGELAITAAPGGGTIVTVRVPLGALPDAGALVSTLVMTGGER